MRHRKRELDVEVVRLWSEGYNETMLENELLDLLVCPLCKTAFSYNKERETLKCGQCHRVYPVREGIPILLVDQATVEQ